MFVRLNCTVLGIYIYDYIYVCVGVCIADLAQNSGNSIANALDLPQPCASLQWRHNGRDGVSNHQPRDCLLNRLFRRGSQKTSNIRVTGLCARNLPVTGEFPAQMDSDAENISLWWRHHVANSENTYQWYALSNEQVPEVTRHYAWVDVYNRSVSYHKEFISCPGKNKHSGEAMYISLIDFQWTSTETKSFQ